MAININVGMMGAAETKTLRAFWNLTNKIALSQTTALPGSPADGDIYIVPAAAGSHAKEIAFRSEGAWLYLVPEEGWMCYVADDDMLVLYDGTAWTPFEPGGGAAGDTVEYSAFLGGKPVPDQMIFRHAFTTATSFPVDFGGSQASSGSASSAATVFDIQKNGADIGTVTWPPVNQIAEFAMATGATFAVGDVLSIVAPTAPDALLSNISISIVGVVT